MEKATFCYRCQQEVTETKVCEGCWSWLCEHCFSVCVEYSCPERGREVADWSSDDLCAMCVHEHPVSDLGDL